MKQQIQELIKKGRLSEAIDLLVKEARKREYEEVEEQIIELSRQLSTTIRNRNLGLIGYQEAQQIEIRVSFAIQGIVSELNWGGENLVKSAEKPAAFIGESQPVKKKVVLFLGSNPSDLAQLQLEKEFVQISKRLQNNTDQFELRAEWTVNGKELQEAILTHKPDIIHFAGHGGWEQAPNSYDDGNNRSLVGLFMNDPDTKNAALVSGEAIGELFGIVKKIIPQLDLVIFNACYSSLQVDAIQQFVSFIGMDKAIEDAAAIEFASGFYLGLTFEPDYEIAFKLAKNRIKLAGLQGGELPSLFLKE